MSKLQVNKLKLGIKNGTGVICKISSNVVGVSNDENNFPYKLLLINTQDLKLRQAFANGLSANMKLSKTQLHQIGKSRELLGRLLGPLLKNGWPLIGHVLQALAESVLLPLELTAASATDAAVDKKIFRSGTRPLDLVKGTTLIISNEEINDLMKEDK